MNKNTIILYVGVGTMLMLLLGIVYSYSVFRLEIESIYQVSNFESGVPYMLALFFFALFMAVGGLLYSRFNTKLVALVGIFMLSFGFVISYFSNSIGFISVSYGVIVGIGVGILYGLPLRIIAQLDHPKTGFLTGITLLGFGLSPLIFAPLLHYFIQTYGLNSTFLMLGIVFFVTTIPLVLILIKQDLLEKENVRFPFKMFQKKEYYSLYILFFIGTFIGLTFIGYVGNIGTELIQLNESTIAILVGIFAIFNGIGRPIFGYLHDQIGFKNSATLSFSTIILAALFSFLFAHSYVIYIISFVIFYLNFGGWLSLAPSSTIKLFGKRDYSRNFGLLYTAYGVGALIGNLMSGYMSELFGLRYIFLLMAAIAIFGLFFVRVQFKENVV